RWGGAGLWHKQIDWEKGPWLRVRLLKTAPDQHLLAVVMHHIVSDGWSVGNLLREVGALYAAFVEGRPSPLPPLPVQYADYVLWQRNWLKGELLDRQLRYWLEKLSAVPLAL